MHRRLLKQWMIGEIREEKIRVGKLWKRERRVTFIPPFRVMSPLIILDSPHPPPLAFSYRGLFHLFQLYPRAGPGGRICALLAATQVSQRSASSALSSKHPPPSPGINPVLQNAWPPTAWDGSIIGSVECS
jgi:hypothetical protein